MVWFSLRHDCALHLAVVVWIFCNTSNGSRSMNQIESTLEPRESVSAVFPWRERARVRLEKLHQSTLETRESVSAFFSTRGCDAGKTCEDCLTRSPWTGSQYCKWCPFNYWMGASQISEAGACRSPSHEADDCTQWVFPGVIGLSQAEPRRANDTDDARVFCSTVDAVHQDEAVRGIQVQKVANKSAQALFDLQLTDSTGLHLALEELNYEVRRLSRFRFTNPPLFEAQMSDARTAKAIAKYTWKATMYGINFIPGFGNAVSLGLGLATDSVEFAMVAETGRSQAKLVANGKDAYSQFFSDLSFGQIWAIYKEILIMTSDEVRAMIEEVLGSFLAQHTSGAAAYNEFNARASVKVAKAAGHIGLFVGGFFTMGATWIAGSIWTGVDLSTAAASHAAVAKAVALKSRMLLGLARLRDESVWEDETDRCDITTAYSDREPCVSKANDQGTVFKRVCVRSSPWKSHKGKVPNGLFSPEGRCHAHVGNLLDDGLPCLTHTSCKHSYCHFEPRIQYFVSDHARRFSKRGVGIRVPIPDQLHSMQVAQVLSPNETAKISKFASVRPLESFAGEYNSFGGVKYATTGTCATACPESSIGSGDCAALTLGDTMNTVEREDTQAARYRFGIKIPNRVMAGYSLQGYALVGYGACASGNKSMVPVRKLELSVPGTGLEMTEEKNEAIAMCTRKSFIYGAYAFEVGRTLGEVPTWECRVFYSHPGFSVHVREGAEEACFIESPHWPMDIYQPWNVEWVQYMSDVRRVLAQLDSENAGEKYAALTEVRKAYKDFCIGDDGQIDERCPDPADWDYGVAISILTSMAPLSVTQMRQLCIKADPECPKTTLAGTAKVNLRDLFKDEEWGVPWKRFLGKLNVEEVENEDPEHPATLQAGFIQKLQHIAVSFNFKMGDGVWDLEAAQKQYLTDLSSDQLELDKDSRE